jgi:hypothetical protein
MNPYTHAPNTTSHHTATSIPSSLMDAKCTPADVALRFCQSIRPNKAVAVKVDPTSQICKDRPTGSSRWTALRPRKPRSIQRWAGGTTNSPKMRKFNNVINRMAFRDAGKVRSAEMCMNSIPYGGRTVLNAIQHVITCGVSLQTLPDG